MLINVNRVFQGVGRYAIYIANYASGKVGPHALIEMDESASDLSQGVIALSNVAEQAGVNKFTGRCEETTVCVCVRVTYTLAFRSSNTTGPSLWFTQTSAEKHVHVVHVPIESEIWDFSPEWGLDGRCVRENWRRARWGVVVVVVGDDTRKRTQSV